MEASTWIAGPFFQKTQEKTYFYTSAKLKNQYVNESDFF